MTRLRPTVPGRPTRAELIELYKGSVDEYRFQVQLNWSRSQYLLALNAALLTAGAGLIKLGGPLGSVLTAAVFLVGAILAGLSIAVTRVQHGYYRAARDRMLRYEDRLALPRDLRVDTTPTMGGPIKRLGRITSMLYLVFGIIALLDVLGAVVAVNTDSAPTVRILPGQTLGPSTSVGEPSSVPSPGSS